MWFFYFQKVHRNELNYSFFSRRFRSYSNTSLIAPHGSSWWKLMPTWDWSCCLYNFILSSSVRILAHNLKATLSHPATAEMSVNTDRLYRVMVNDQSVVSVLSFQSYKRNCDSTSLIAFKKRVFFLFLYLCFFFLTNASLITDMVTGHFCRWCLCLLMGHWC